MRLSLSSNLRWAIRRPSWNTRCYFVAALRSRYQPILRSAAPLPTPTLAPANRRCFSATRPARFSLDADSTIYALSTASGRAAIAVVRVSGNACVEVSLTATGVLRTLLTQWIRIDIQSPMSEYIPPETTARRSTNALRTGQ